MEELLDNVKTLIGLGDTGEDALLTLYLQRGTRLILSYMVDGQNYTQVPPRYVDLLIDAVLVAYNQQGAEGTRSTSSSGISQSWTNSAMADYIHAHMPAKPIG
jgi:hypothetical protein